MPRRPSRARARHSGISLACTNGLDGNDPRDTYTGGGRREWHVMAAGVDLVPAPGLEPFGGCRAHVHLLDDFPPPDTRIVRAEGDLSHLGRVRDDAHLGAPEVVIEQILEP